MYSKNSKPNSPNKWSKSCIHTNLSSQQLVKSVNAQTANHTPKTAAYVQLVNNYHISTKYVILTFGFLSAHDRLYYTCLFSAGQKLFVYARDELCIWSWTVVYGYNIITGELIYIHPIWRRQRPLVSWMMVAECSSCSDAMSWISSFNLLSEGNCSWAWNL